MTFSKPICFFDIESTGLDVAKDRIISLAIARHTSDDWGGTDENFIYNVNPGIPIPPEASKVHGLTDDKVKDWPHFSYFARSISEILAGCDIAGFNCINYDVPLLWEEFARCGITWDLSGVNIIDVGNIFKLKEKRTLEAACLFYDCDPLTEAHNSMADTWATEEVFFAQLARYKDLGQLDTGDLAKFCAMDKRIDLAGKIVRNEAGVPVYNFGKAKGVPVISDPGFGNWILRNDFSRNTHNVVSKILKGEIV